jgi:hypothetical protein
VWNHWAQQQFPRIAVFLSRSALGSSTTNGTIAPSYHNSGCRCALAVFQSIAFRSTAFICSFVPLIFQIETAVRAQVMAFFFGESAEQMKATPMLADVHPGLFVRTAIPRSRTGL